MFSKICRFIVIGAASLCVLSGVITPFLAIKVVGDYNTVSRPDKDKKEYCVYYKHMYDSTTKSFIPVRLKFCGIE